VKGRTGWLHDNVGKEGPVFEMGGRGGGGRHENAAGVVQARVVLYSLLKKITSFWFQIIGEVLNVAMQVLRAPIVSVTTVTP
jgi:hypothetical protein